MELLSDHIDIGAVRALLPPLLTVALLLALALVTGAAGRVAMFIEELLYRSSDH